MPAPIALCMALLVSGCCSFGGCPLEAMIGKETARGTTSSEGRTFGYVYRKYGVPMYEALVSYPDGQKKLEMTPALYDAGVPLIEIFATSGRLEKSDERLARNAALALCEQNSSWLNDTAEAIRPDEVFDDFFDVGVWSFVMVCR